MNGCDAGDLSKRQNCMAERMSLLEGDHYNFKFLYIVFFRRGSSEAVARLVFRVAQKCTYGTLIFYTYPKDQRFYLGFSRSTILQKGSSI